MEQILYNLEIGSINGHKVMSLSKEYAKVHISELVRLANLIPHVTYTELDILADQKQDRILHRKWDHSLVVVDDLHNPIGFIIGYEREAEHNEQYPENTLYIGEIVIDPKFQGQGIGKELLKLFITYNKQIGFLDLNGEFNFSVQTNSAPFNKKVQDLYLKQGFNIRAVKHYDKSESGEERDDYVFGLLL